ncbi:MAG: hypothetical protein ABFE01_26085, partial [Phycisphaerales bacterium]
MEFHTEGMQWEFNVVYRQTESLPTNLYLALVKDTVIAENAAMADLTELTAGEAPGYARQAITCSSVGWVEAGTGTNDRKITGTAVTFTADGGNWPTAYIAVLTTTLTGTTGPLIASGELNSGSGRQADDGESFDV